MEDHLKLERTITATREMPAGSIWFDGHFPGNPILPGIAQLAMVVGVLEEALKRKVAVTRVSRIRFKTTIHPGEKVTIGIRSKPGDPMTYSFQISNSTEQAAGGNLTIAG